MGTGEKEELLRAWVLYESVFGNTAAVANAIADGLRPHGDVQIGPVGDDVPDVDLLVLGAPTHAHGLPSALSRSSLERIAEEKAAKGETLEYNPTYGMRKFIENLPAASGANVACFDTRFERSAILTGSAARTMTRKLRRKGYAIVRTPESFFVIDSEGPLAEGELERAEAWGASLAAELEPAI